MRNALSHSPGAIRHYELFSELVERIVPFCSFGSREAESEARIIMEHSCGEPFSRIMAMFWREKVNEKAVDEALGIARRRAGREPIQYIIGETEFFGFRFKVTPDVLIPRNDTASIVEALIGRVKKSEKYLSGKVFSALDIGTGSGAIAIAALKSLGANFRMTAVDVSEAALEIARYNALQNECLDGIEFAVSDLFTYFERQTASNGQKRLFDLIVSNPPYISKCEYISLAPEVKMEPKTALIAENDGYEFYEKIISGAGGYLSAGGGMIFEIGHTMAPAVIKIAAGNGYMNCDKIYDIEKRIRGLNLWA